MQTVPVDRFFLMRLINFMRAEEPITDKALMRTAKGPEHKNIETHIMHRTHLLVELRALMNMKGAEEVYTVGLTSATLAVLQDGDRDAVDMVIEQILEQTKKGA